MQDNNCIEPCYRCQQEIVGQVYSYQIRDRHQKIKTCFFCRECYNGRPNLWNSEAPGFVYSENLLTVFQRSDQFECRDCLGFIWVEKKFGEWLCKNCFDKKNPRKE